MRASDQKNDFATVFLLETDVVIGFPFSFWLEISSFDAYWGCLFFGHHKNFGCETGVEIVCREHLYQFVAPWGPYFEFYVVVGS